jgi:bla regulator protein blaR1
MLFRAGVSNAVSATLLALVVAGLSRPLARRPAILHCLWLLVLLKLVTPPLYEVPIPWPSLSRPLDHEEPAAEVVSTIVDPRPAVEMPGDAFVVEWDLATDLPAHSRVEALAGVSLDKWWPTDWVRPLVAVWLGGTAMILIVSVRRILRFQRLLRETRPASQVEQGRVDALASRLGLRRGPLFEWVQAKLSPMIWSLGWRPRLIVPRDLWKSLDEAQRSTLIVHELAHLRRGDHRVRYFELFVTTLFWWHPLVWWVRQALRDAEEHCCDAWVVWAFPDAARSYAETLLETIDFLDKSKGPEPQFASGFGKVHHLRRRLTMILSESTPRRLGGWGMLGLFGLAAMMLPVNATWAQKSEESKKIAVVVKPIVDVSTTIDGAAEGQVNAGASALVDVLTLVDKAADDTVVVNLKIDDSPEIVVSGSLQEVIERLKLILKEVKVKSSLSGREMKLLKPLEEAIEQLARPAPQLKGELRVQKPGGDAEPVSVVIQSIRSDSTQKALSKEEKAEIEKLQAEVKKLNAEMLSKQKALAEAQTRLAKLQGASPDAPHYVTFRPLEKGMSKSVVVKRHVKEVRSVDESSPKAVELKKVDPTKSHFEIHVDSPISTSVKRKAPIPSDQQRIDELEQKLKSLLDEVTTLKQSKSTGDSGK